LDLNPIEHRGPERQESEKTIVRQSMKAQRMHNKRGEMYEERLNIDNQFPLFSIERIQLTTKEGIKRIHQQARKERRKNATMKMIVLHLVIVTGGDFHTMELSITRRLEKARSTTASLCFAFFSCCWASLLRSQGCPSIRALSPLLVGFRVV
jgi:hypothetical protein